MTAEELLAIEERAMGQPVELVDSAILHDEETGTETTVILYSSQSKPIHDLGSMRVLRFAVRSTAEDLSTNGTSGIAATTWPDREEPS